MSDRAAELASQVERGTLEMIELIDQCSDEFWRSSPDPDDPRPVGVICHHVGVSQLDNANWIRRLLKGEHIHITPELVHAANASHAADFRNVERRQAIEVLRRSGAELAALLRGLTEADLAKEQPLADGGSHRVDVFAEIAGRHARNHAAAIQKALQSAGPLQGGRLRSIRRGGVGRTV